MDWEIITLSEVRKRKTNIPWSLIYVETEMWHKMNLLMKKTHKYRKATVTKEKGGGEGIIWEFGISYIYT